MKKIILFGLIFFAYSNINTIRDWLNPPPDYSNWQGGQVILYSAAWCGYCDKTRALLNRYQIPFAEYDVETSDKGKRDFQKLNGNGIPIVVMDETVIYGYDPQRIQAVAEVLQQ